MIFLVQYIEITPKKIAIVFMDIVFTSGFILFQLHTFIAMFYILYKENISFQFKIIAKIIFFLIHELFLYLA